eukprot:CAMPEP_0178950466 /NCGR_PEP_ID=MMETSP0789-20121207/6667_1 /TAXON_ID=3005 /ORGANISM="Rhizosolenia setigera, Strain CCMP 1694" /LENGTH=338 /DNA_ID=CAMNT_0020631193 /DNA_START=255 /DNA_END=1271 /DNA_ORIENTATION=-
MSDHMLTMEWDVDKKWSAAKIVPYQDLKISPAASVLHYGLECFEGMKAYKSLDNPDEVRLFRPDLNMKRLMTSMERLSMPTDDLNPDNLLECIKTLCEVDKNWIPHGEGYSLYLRPTVICTNPFLGVAAPTKMLLYVITSPVGPYYKSGSFQPVKLTTDSPFVRAWPGGTGCYKLGGNYGPSIKASTEAAKDGYDQVLYLFNDEVTEVGAMNIFFLIWNEKTNKKELITPPLDRGDILPGVTRRSIMELTLTKWEEEIDVVERFLTMTEVKKASEEKRLLEVFGAGTAAVVSPVECIRYKGEDIVIPAVGDFTKKIWENLISIQYGKIEGPEGWSVVV